MPRTWGEVSSSPEFQALGASEQEAARQQYFSQVVAPKVDDADIEAARSQFDQQTRIAKRDLPAGAAQSDAGGGRGAVNPPAVTPAPDAGPTARRGTMRAVAPFGAGDERVVAAPPQLQPSVLERPAAAVDPNWQPSEADLIQQSKAPATIERERAMVAANAARDTAPSATAAPGPSAVDQAASATREALHADRTLGGQVAGRAVQSTGDLYLSASKVLPETLKLASDIVQIGTGGMNKGFSDWLQLTSDAMGEAQSSKLRSEHAELSQLLQNPNANAGDVAAFLVAHPEYAVNAAVPSVGSMVLGVGGGRAGAAIAEKIAAARGSVGAELERAATHGATVGANTTNAAMNAGDTFSQTDGDLGDKYLAAGIAAGTTALAGHALEGGAEGAIARHATATSRPGAVLGTLAKEGAQESIEQLGQDTGQALGEGKPLDPNALAKSATVAGGLGALMGAGAGTTMPVEAKQQSYTDLAKSKGFLRPTQHIAESLKGFDDLAAGYGLPSAAVKATKERIDGMPAEQVPGFLQRAAQAFAKRGMFARPLDDAALQMVVPKPPEAEKATAEAPAPTATAPAASGEDFSGLADTPLGVAAVPQGALADQAAAALPTEPTTDHPTDAAAHEAATSPTHGLPPPTDAQKEAGNYKVGRLRIGGLDISIENPHGSIRSGTSPDGTRWQNTMAAHYGYVKGTLAGDGDHSDVFVKPGTNADYSGPVFVIDQIDPNTGRFDEHKSVLGASSADEARALYLANYAPGWNGLGAITELPMQAFRSWVHDGVKRKPLGDITGAANDLGRDANTAGHQAAAPADTGADRGTGDVVSSEQPGGGSAGTVAEPVASAGPAGDAGGNAGERDGTLTATRNADGTLLVKGDPAAIKAALPNLKGITGKRGVTYGRTAADKVMAALAQSTEAPASAAETGKPAAAPAQEASAPTASWVIRDQDKQHPGHTWTVVPAPEFGEGRFKLEGRKAAPGKAGSPEPVGTSGGTSVSAPAAPAPSQAAKKTPTRAAAAKSRMAFNPEHDTMLQALAKMGGLSRDVAAKEFGLKPEELKHTVSVGGLKGYPFRAKNGRGLDSAIEALQEAGYFAGVADEDVRTKFEEAIYNELGGKATMTPQGNMRQAEAAYNAQEQALKDEADAEAQAERDAIMAESGVSESGMLSLSDDDIDLDAKSNVSTESFMRSMGFTEQEIADEIAREEARGSAQGNAAENRALVTEEAGPADGARSAEPRAASAQVEGLTTDRFAAGRSLTPQQRKQVLGTLVDVYKAKQAPREQKGFDRNGNERHGYVHSPDLFEKSDITGAMVRYHVTLPDGRIAHPSELFPDFTQAEIDTALIEQAAAEKQDQASQSEVAERAERRGKPTREAAAADFLARNLGHGFRREDLAYFTKDGKVFATTKDDTAHIARLKRAGWADDAAPLLEAQTTADLKAKTEREAAAAAEEKNRQKDIADKARADAQRNEFTLTGSDRPADVAAAAGQQGLKLSRAPDTAERHALQALSENDALFALPKSDKTTVEGIAADTNPAINVRKMQGVPGRTDYDLTMPSGSVVRLIVRPPNPYGPSRYGFDMRDGEAVNVLEERPGENPEDVPPSTEDVWIDASQLKPGEDGTQVYNIAATFAHNTGRIFIGDPAGLSDEALRRRSEQMLSSALKFGTTAHLAPHPRQVAGDSALGVPPLKWVYGDDLGNIRRLVDLNLKAIDNAFPTAKKLGYDLASGQFTNADTGRPVRRERLAESIMAAWRAGGSARGSLAGRRTVARAAVLRALLREEGAGVQGADGQRDGLLARLAGIAPGLSDPNPENRIFYSRGSVEPTTPGGTFAAHNEGVKQEDGSPFLSHTAATRRLTDAGYTVEFNDRDAPIVKKDGTEADYQSMPAKLKEAWNALSVDDPGEPEAPRQRVDFAVAKQIASLLAAAGMKPINVVDRIGDLPDDKRKKIESIDPSGNTRGVYFPDSDETWIVASNIRNADEFVFVALHETFHRGLRATLGAEAGKVLRQIYATNKNVRELADQQMQSHGIDKETAIEEALADLAGRGEVRNLNGWSALLRLIRTWLGKIADKLGMKLTFTDEMVADFVAGITREGANAQAIVNTGGPLASRAPRYTPEQTDALSRAGIGGQKTLADKLRGAWASTLDTIADRNALAQEFRQGALDQFHGIDRAVKREIGNLPTEQDPYVTARMANGGTSSVMRALLLHGQAQWAGNGQHLEKIAGTEGLLDILKPLGEDIDAWFGWMIGNRAARLKREGRENNFTDAQIAALQSLAVGKDAAFKAAAVKYAAFKRSVLDVAQGAGLIDPEGRKVWDNADYIPFYRQLDETGASRIGKLGKRGLAGQTSGIRTLKGGEAALNDPMENLLMNFSRLIDASLKNNALRRTVDVLAGTGVVSKVGYDMKGAVVPAAQVKKVLIDAGTPAQVLAVIPSEAFDGMAKMWSIQPPADPAAVRVMVDGKPQFYKVNDPLLLRSLTSFVPFDFPGLGVMRAFKRVLTATVTATPEFMARNFIRDSLAGQAITRDGFNPVQSITGIAKSYREMGGFENMLFAGASFQSGNINAADPASTGVAMRRALRDRGLDASSANAFIASLIDTPARFWEKYRHVGEAIENANREAVYDAAIQSGKTPTAAAFEAKDMMDFNLRGSWAAYQLLADVLPFFNARVQGLYRLGRSDPKRLVTYGLLLTAASVMLAMANAGADWYEELPDWDKDTYWHFKVAGQHFRIPKPFELGVVFATVPERIARAMAGRDATSKTIGRIWANLRDQLAFDPMPQAFRPAVNVWANKDTFRDAPIENMTDEGKLPSMRYSASTSDTARVAMKGAGPVADALGLSPKRVEYLVSGYLGTAGQYALGLSDMLVRKIEGKPPGPALRVDDLPVVKSFYRIDPARATVFESDLYKMREEVEQVFKSIKAAEREGDAPQRDDLIRRNLPKVAARDTITTGSNLLRDLNKERDAVIADKKMTPQQKRERIDAIQVQKNRIAKQTVQSPAVKAAF